MRKQRYFPSRTAEQVQWLLHFASKLPDYQAELELSGDELAALVADARFAAYVLGSWLGAVRTFADAASTIVEEALHGTGAGGLPVLHVPQLPNGVSVVPKGALDRIFRFIQIAKHRPRFNEVIATVLGITPVRENTRREFPRFNLRIVRGNDGAQVQIGYSKYGRPGVWIESRRAGGTIEELGIAVGTPWLDKRPLLVPGQPEMREYRMRFWENGGPAGEWTPWREIVVPG